MHLSIVTVVKNDFKGLIKTYKSIELLLRSDLIEWVVIDGGEDSETFNFLSSLKGASYSRDQDSGIYPAMNKAIPKCKGQFIWFLNARDKNTLSLNELLIDISTNDSFDVLKYFARVKQSGYKHDEKLGLFYLIRNTFNHQSYLVKSSLLIKFQFDERLALTGDYKQLLELWYSGCSVGYIYKEIVEYDMSGATVGSLTNNKIREERLSSSLSVAFKNKSISVFLIYLFQKIIYFPFLFKEYFLRKFLIYKRES